MTSTFAERPPVTRLPAMVTATLKKTYSERLLGFASARRSLHFCWQPGMHVRIITYMRHIARAQELKDVTKAPAIQRCFGCEDECYTVTVTPHVRATATRICPVFVSGCLDVPLGFTRSACMYIV